MGSDSGVGSSKLRACASSSRGVGVDDHVIIVSRLSDDWACGVWARDGPISHG